MALTCCRGFNLFVSMMLAAVFGCCYCFIKNCLSAKLWGIILIISHTHQNISNMTKIRLEFRFSHFYLSNVRLCYYIAWWYIFPFSLFRNFRKCAQRFKDWIDGLCAWPVFMLKFHISWQRILSFSLLEALVMQHRGYQTHRQPAGSSFGSPHKAKQN